MPDPKQKKKTSQPSTERMSKRLVIDTPQPIRDSFGQDNQRFRELARTQKQANETRGRDKVQEKEVLDWTKNYINSSKYKERLSNFYSDPDNVRKQRLQGINNANIWHGSSSDIFSSRAGEDALAYYNPLINGVTILDDRISKLGKRPDGSKYPHRQIMEQGVLAHELSHANNSGLLPGRSLNSKEKEFINSRNISRQQRLDEPGGNLKWYESRPHGERPEEIKSDMDALRFMLKKRGIYDAGTQDFNQEILNKASSDAGISTLIQELFGEYNDEDIIEMMNKVAVNDLNAAPIGENGLKIKNMPDNRRKIANTDADLEKARVARIQELSKEWGVPTSAIYSQANRNASAPYNSPGSSRNYYTFDDKGNINRQVIDRSDLPLGQSMYTPEDIALQQKFPGRGMTVRQQEQMMQPVQAVQPAVAGLQYRYGGLMGTQAHVSPLGSSNMTYASGGRMQFKQGSSFEDCEPYYTTNWSNGQNGIGGIPPKVYEQGGQMFNNGSMFTKDVPPNYNSRFPPKVYNFGGAVNHFGPQTKVKNSNRPANTQDYNTAFSANPFPANYSTWDSPYARNSYVDTFEMGGPITYNPTSYLDPNFEPTPIAESGIHIKPENRGKFTAAANRAGMGVQEYASHVLSNPNASPTLRKRANFARNASKWNRYGGSYAQYGDVYPSADFPGAVSTPDNPMFYEEGTLPINTPIQTASQNNRQGQSQQGGGFQASMTLGTAAPIALASAAIGQSVNRQTMAKDSATQKRRNVTQGPYHNPYSYGSGATNLYDNGGRIKRTNGMTLSDAMDIIRQHGYDIEIE